MSKQFETALSTTFGEAQALLLRKHHDYGPHNISRAPGGPLVGLAVRLHDKIARIGNLMQAKPVVTLGCAPPGTILKQPQNESLRDSFLDIANYAIIGLMVMDGNWPDAQGKTQPSLTGLATWRQAQDGKFYPPSSETFDTYGQYDKARPSFINISPTGQ